MENEQNSSCKAAQELRRAYQGYLKLTETNKKKLLSSLAKDPPRPADQERYVHPLFQYHGWRDTSVYCETQH